MASGLLMIVLLATPLSALATSVLYIGEQWPLAQALMNSLKARADARSDRWEIPHGNEHFSLFIGFSEMLDDDHRQVLSHPKALMLADLCQRVEVILAAGFEATRWIRSRCNKPLLSVLATRRQIDTLIATSGALSAIYLEADPALNLALIAKVLRPTSRVGVLVSDHTQSDLARLKIVAARLDLELTEIHANHDEAAVRALRQYITKLDTLLLLPDNTLINAWSLKPILLMTARQFIPVFGGVNESYVKAGVTAAIIADVEGLRVQIDTMIPALAQSLTPTLSYPHATRVVVNPVVAQALSIDTEVLLRADEH